MDKWKIEIGAVSLSGDTTYVCPKCGFDHLFGETNREVYPMCPACGERLFYPWEIPVTDAEDFFNEWRQYEV